MKSVGLDVETPSRGQRLVCYYYDREWQAVRVTRTISSRTRISPMESRRVQRALEILGQCGTEWFERIESKLGSAAFIDEHSLTPFGSVFCQLILPKKIAISHCDQTKKDFRSLSVACWLHLYNTESNCIPHKRLIFTKIREIKYAF